MRVHQLSNNYSAHAGGAEKLVRQLHQSLLQAGYDSQLVGLEQHTDTQIPQAQSLGCRSPYELRAFLRLLRYIRRHVTDGDIIHAHLFPTIFYISLIKLLRLTRASVVMTEHSTDNTRRNRWLMP